MITFRNLTWPSSYRIEIHFTFDLHLYFENQWPFCMSLTIGVRYENLAPISKNWFKVQILFCLLILVIPSGISFSHFSFLSKKLKIKSKYYFLFNYGKRLTGKLRKHSSVKLEENHKWSVLKHLFSWNIQCQVVVTKLLQVHSDNLFRVRSKIIIDRPCIIKWKSSMLLLHPGQGNSSSYVTTYK